jgi:uncharacterized protein YndB with AHSA1/START domain
MSTTRLTAEPGTPFVELEREFDAPRDLVLRAWTDPELVIRWLGPRRLAMRIDRWDVQEHGGAYRYVHVEPDGTEYGFRGVFHRTSDPFTILQTFEFEGAPGHVSLDELRLTEHDGRTTARIRSVHQSVAARDALLASGMESGMNEGFDRLDEVLDGELARAR